MQGLYVQGVYVLGGKCPGVSVLGVSVRGGGGYVLEPLDTPLSGHLIKSVRQITILFSLDPVYCKSLCE